MVEVGSSSEWSVLTSHWLEAVGSADSTLRPCSPLEALGSPGDIRCLALASPLDLFAAHRFLLVLLYWKAGEAGGVQSVRESLLRGKMPKAIVGGIAAEADRFRLFDDEEPFLQDPSIADTKRQDWKSAGSLFAEFATGTNIAHFHHGDDKKMRLCLRCATLGMLRVAPWSQSGGAGLTPSIHGAPPIMALALGPNLSVTLGLNLVPLSAPAGTAKWSGHFECPDDDPLVPYLDALTWNPRRIHLLPPELDAVCWGCGETGLASVGPIIYLKNENTKKRSDKQPFAWQDPAAFYTPDRQYNAIRSGGRGDWSSAIDGRDLRNLVNEKHPPTSAVGAANPDHRDWCLVIPCTNPANNKTFDHRAMELASLSPQAIRAALPSPPPPRRTSGLDGWREPRESPHRKGASRFVWTAARLLTPTDWAALSNAAYREMHDFPAAFDVLSGLLWSLRRRVSGLPSRNVAWLTLKLMATVPPKVRIPRPRAFSPLRSLPKRQTTEGRTARPRASPYPLSLPRGHQLEAHLRREIDRNLRRRAPQRIDWAGLCDSLDQLIG